MSVQVRQNQIKTFLDCSLLNTLPTDGSNLSMLNNWSINAPENLGLGAYDSETTFHRVRIRPVTPPTE